MYRLLGLVPFDEKQQSVGRFSRRGSMGGGDVLDAVVRGRGWKRGCYGCGGRWERRFSKRWSVGGLRSSRRGDLHGCRECLDAVVSAGRGSSRREDWCWVWRWCGSQHLHTLLHFPIHNTLFSHILSTTRILLPTRIPLLILTHPYAYCRSWLMM